MSCRSATACEATGSRGSRRLRRTVRAAAGAARGETPLRSRPCACRPGTARPGAVTRVDEHTCRPLGLRRRDSPGGRASLERPHGVDRDRVRDLTCGRYTLRGFRERSPARAERPAFERHRAGPDRAGEPCELVGLEHDVRPVARDGSVDQPRAPVTAGPQQEAQRPQAGPAAGAGPVDDDQTLVAGLGVVTASLRRGVHRAGNGTATSPRSLTQRS